MSNPPTIFSNPVLPEAHLEMHRSSTMFHAMFHAKPSNMPRFKCNAGPVWQARGKVTKESNRLMASPQHNSGIGRCDLFEVGKGLHVYLDISLSFKVSIDQTIYLFH